MAGQTMTIQTTVDLAPEAMSLLAEIRDRLPAPGKPAVVVDDAALEQAKQYGRTHALSAILIALDDWIETAKSNHHACEHWGENIGDECWKSFTPADIRDIVNDAAREVGVREWPRPENPIEDRP